MIPVIDVHCHVYPAAIAEKAAAAVAAFYRVRRGDGVADLAGLPEVLARECVGTYNVIHSVATVPRQVEDVNRFVASVAAKDDRFLAFGTLHPDSEPDAMARQIAQILDLGLKGIKLHPDMQGFALNSSACYDMVEACAGRFLLLLHTGDTRYARSNPEQLMPLLEQFPETTFIGAHMAGYTCWEHAGEVLAGRYPNLYVDISSTMFALTPERTAALVRAYGADRVLFGSDFPMWHPRGELERFLALPLTKAEQDAILYDNAARLLGLPPRGKIEKERPQK